jgi:NTP pyrophosphatase (non-canonical NTP hydrolase)
VPDTYPLDEALSPRPDDDPVIAAMHYATLALMQRIRPDALVPLGGHPPTAGYAWPSDWLWEPSEAPNDNLRKARYLLDVALAEGVDEVLEGGYPSQTAVADWIARNFPGDTGIHCRTLGLVEEVGELCRALVKREQGIRGTTEEWDLEIRKELGDCFIKLLDVAEQTGFDLATVATLRWMDVRQRDWIKNPLGHGLPESA